MPLPASPARDGVVAGIAALLALAYFAVAWLSMSGIPALSPDALEYGLVARNLVETGTFTADLVVVHPGLAASIRHPPELHGLLQPFLIVPPSSLLGPGADAVRLPALLSGAALIFATFDLGRAQAGALAGLLAAACLALHHDFFIWTVMASDDVTWAFLSTVSVRLFLTGCRDRRPSLLVAAGSVAGLATLQKVTGVILPITFAGVLLADRSLRGLLSWRSGLGLATPVALALAAYATRNLASRDMLGFAFTGIDWLTKAGTSESAYFAHYDRAPRMTDVVRELGAARVLSVTAAQLVHVGRALLASPLLGVLGPAALLWLVRKSESRTFAATSLIHVGLLVGIVTFGYHVETRYLSSLLPLSAVALGTATTRAASWLAARRRPSLLRFGIAVTTGLVLVAHEVPSTVALVGAVARLERGAEPCRDALAFVRVNTRPDEAVLTSNPWWVAWETRRPAVQAPTNGGAALGVVARHYRTTWAVTGRAVVGAAFLEAALSDPHPAVRDLSPVRAHDGPVCDVYRFRGVSSSALPTGPLLTHR